jgi:hypothetical protein
MMFLSLFQEESIERTGIGERAPLESRSHHSQKKSTENFFPVLSFGSDDIFSNYFFVITNTPFQSAGGGASE